MKLKNIWRALIAGALIVGAVGAMSSCSFQEVKDDVKSNVTSGVDSVRDKLGITLVNSEYVRLTSETVQDETNYPSQKLTATVYPESIADSLKMVDWSVEWIENKTGDENALVTDYVTVTPDADGSTTATVKALQPFYDSSISVKVKTRTADFTASCTVTYIGKPSYLGFFKVLEDGSTSFVNNAPVLTARSATSFELNLDNALNSVGSDFGEYTVVKYGATGSFKAKSGMYMAGSWSDSATIADFDANEYISRFVASATIEGDVLTITAGGAVNEFIDVNFNENYRAEYVSGAENVEFYVVVRDTVSGVDNTIYFTIQSDIMSVSLNTPSISF